MRQMLIEYRMKQTPQFNNC